MAIRFVIRQNGSDTGGNDNQAAAEHVFDENLFTIGSDAANHLVIAESAPEQAVVVREEDFLTLINRAEGTALNGTPLRREAFQPLGHGDRIEIKTYTIFVYDSETPEDVSAFVATEIPKPDEPLPPPEKPAARPNATVPDADTQKPVAPRNFAAVLDTLRTEEDSFYFIVETRAKKEIRRIPLEHTEMPLGISQRGAITSDSEEISTVFGVARKDWSGILLEAVKPNTIFVNGEPVSDARRLRNDDRISFPPSVKETLVLHEPSSLVALESILTARESSEARFGIHKTSGAETTSLTAVATAAKTEKSLFERTFFGHFSFLEVITMFFATLIGAVLIFLFLEFMFS